MSGLRISAAAVVLVEAVLFGLATGDHAAAVTAGILALAGGVTGAGIETGRDRRNLVIVSLMGVVALWSVLLPFSMPGVMPISRYPRLVHAAGQFALIFQALQLFIVPVLSRKEIRWVKVFWGLDAAFPFYGVAVLLSAADQIATAQVHRLFQWCSLLFVLMTLSYLMACRRRSLDGVRRHGPAHHLTLAVTAVAVAGAGWLGSAGVSHYGNRVDTLFYRVFFRSSPPKTAGFDRSTSLGSIARMKSGEGATALRVFSEGEPGYLRGGVYDTYVGGKWKESPSGESLSPLSRPPANVLSGREGDRIFAMGTEDARSLNRFDVWPAPHLRDLLFLPPGTRFLSAPAVTLRRDGHGIVSPLGMPSGAPYTAFAAAGRPDAYNGEEPGPGFFGLPSGLDPSIVELAGSIFGDAPLPADAAAARVEHYFRSNYRYDLGIEVPPGRDPLTWFLLEKPAAHCEFFASGAVLLLRLAGIPSRYVTGFVVPERHPWAGYWYARNRNAHAWAEAFDEEKGWMLVESTPPAGVPRAEGDSRAVHLKDYLRQRWREIRTAFSAKGIGGALSAAGGFAVELLARARVVLLPILLAGVILFLVRKVRFRGKASSPPTGSSSKELAALGRLLAAKDAQVSGRGLKRGPSETLHAFAERLDRYEGGEDLGIFAEWYRRYAYCRYARPVTEKLLRALREDRPAHAGEGGIQ